VRVNNKEHWIPLKLCRDIIVNNKLGGNLCVPIFVAEKMNVEFTPDIEYIHHIPEVQDTSNIKHDKNLFK
jgi:hypothetical protein